MIPVDTQNPFSSGFDAGFGELPTSRLGPWGVPMEQYGDFSGKGAVITVAVSGTALSATESQIVEGGRTIVLTLTNDTWVAAGGTFDAERQAIIDGLDSAQTETTGWNAEVRDKEVVGAVVRTSDTVVTITLSASASYAITANETITVTVPASALTASAAAVVGSPTIGITAEAAAEGAGGGRRRRRGRRIQRPTLLPPVGVQPERKPQPKPPTFRELVAAAEALAEPGTPEFDRLLEIARDLAPPAPETLSRQDVEDVVVVQLAEFRARQEREREEAAALEAEARMLAFLEVEELGRLQGDEDMVKLLLLLVAADG